MESTFARLFPYRRLAVRRERRASNFAGMLTSGRRDYALQDNPNGTNSKAMPAQAAKCPAFVNVEASRISSKILAAVLTPMPGIEVSSSTAGRGHQSSIDGRQRRYDETCPAAAVSLAAVLRCTKPGGTTLRIMDSTGDISHAGPGEHGSLIRSYNDGNVDDHARGRAGR